MARRQGRSVPWINTLIRISHAVRTDEWRWYNDVWNYLVSIGVCICLWKLFLEGSLPIFVWWCCQGVFHLVVHGVWNGVWAYVSLVCIGCLVLVLVCAYLAGSSGVLYSGLLILLLLCDFPALNRNGWNVVDSWFYVCEEGDGCWCQCALGLLSQSMVWLPCW